METFGKYLEDLRIRSGFKSQRQLALRSGLSSATLSRIEADTQKPQPETLKILANYLKGVSYADLMDKAGYLDDVPDEFKPIKKENIEIQSELDDRLESILDKLTYEGNFKKQHIPKVLDLTSRYEALFGDEPVITPDVIRKVIKDDYALYIKADFISELNEIFFPKATPSPIERDPDVQFIMRARKDLSPKAYEKFMQIARDMEKRFRDEEDNG